MWASVRIRSCSSGLAEPTNTATQVGPSAHRLLVQTLAKGICHRGSPAAVMGTDRPDVVGVLLGVPLTDRDALEGEAPDDVGDSYPDVCSRPVGELRIELVPEPVRQGDFGALESPRPEIVLDLAMAVGTSLARQRPWCHEVHADQMRPTAHRGRDDLLELEERVLDWLVAAAEQQLHDGRVAVGRLEEHTSQLQPHFHLL